MSITEQEMIFILYVTDQETSSRFYERLLKRKPELEVPGMTEFRLSSSSRLGLMPAEGIKRLLGDSIPHPSQANNVPRCELYLYTDDVQDAWVNALACGAKPLSPVMERNWGDLAGYVTDPDGHVVALAQCA